MHWKQTARSNNANMNFKQHGSSLHYHIAVRVDPWKYVEDRDVILFKMSCFFVASPAALVSDLVV